MEIRKTSRKRGLDYEQRNRADFKKSSSDNGNVAKLARRT